MKKKSVNLITAVGVLVVLSGAYVGVKAYVAKQEAADTESAEEENPEIISIASADVKSIKFVIDKKEVTFEKDGDSWVKSDETGFPVDQDKIRYTGQLPEFYKSGKNTGKCGGCIRI